WASGAITSHFERGNIWGEGNLVVHYRKQRLLYRARPYSNSERCVETIRFVSKNLGIPGRIKHENFVIFSKRHIQDIISIKPYRQTSYPRLKRNVRSKHRRRARRVELQKKSGSGWRIVCDEQVIRTIHS